MAIKKTKIDLKRVNMNLPYRLVDRVVAYGEELGINTTTAYIVLLNQALDQKNKAEKLKQELEEARKKKRK